MPELPEVETVRAGLAPVLTGRTFERVEIHDPRLVRPYEPAEVAAELEGERVAAVERRGKYLIFRFESGRVLLIHLRLTGSLRHAERIDRSRLRRRPSSGRAAVDARIARQGSTLRDYALPHGRSCSMQHEFKVYGREGEPCDRCGTPIAKTRVAGRGTWFCPTCQPARAQIPQAASSSSRRPSRSRRQAPVEPAIGPASN